MHDKRGKYIPPLSHRWLTFLYDPVLRRLMPEYAFKRDLVKQARIEKNHSLLDLGCGTATLTILIKQTHSEAEVVGLDGDTGVLKIAATKVERAGLDIRLDAGMAYDLPYPDNSFDRVVSSLLFHHLTREHKRRTAHEILRVLKPGGEAYIVDFGKPSNVLMYLISLVMRRFEQARDNIEGLLPQVFREAGFDGVEELAGYATLFGTLSLYRACKNGRAAIRGAIKSMT